MPHIEALGDFNGRDRGSYTIKDDGYVAVAIGPGSLTDAVLVNGRVLRAGQVLPVARNQALNVSQFRAYRHDGQAEVIDQAELLLWKCGEAVAPFHRSPVLVHSVTNVAADATDELVLRVPFQGRRMAQISASAVENGSGTVSATFAIYGIKYRPRALLPTEDPPAEPNVDMVELNPATDIPIDGTVVGDSIETAIGYIGGTDSAEHFDELEIRVTVDTGDFGDIAIRVVCEAWGENL